MTEKEKWCVIPGSNGFYEASTLGRIRSYFIPGPGSRRRSYPTMMTIRVGKRGYPCLRLVLAGKRNLIYVHTLILLTFIGQKPENFQCAHLDGNPENNKLKNLKWTTIHENMSHKKLHGTYLHGESHPRAKFTDLCILAIKDKLSKWKNGEISKYYGVTMEHVSRIKHGRVRAERSAFRWQADRSGNEPSLELTQNLQNRAVENSQVASAP